MEDGAAHAPRDKKPAALPRKLIRQSLKHRGSHHFCSIFNSLLDIPLAADGMQDGG